MKRFSIVKTVKEASVVCQSFLDGVVIFGFSWGFDNFEEDGVILITTQNNINNQNNFKRIEQPQKQQNKMT